MKQTNKVQPGRRRVLQSLSAMPLAALTGACALAAGPGPPPALYRLMPKSTFRKDLPTVRWQLVLEVPIADAALNTTRIALFPDPTHVEYYARASWIDRAPQMVQTLLIESFENADRIVSVGRDSVALRADFLLKTELREFQAEYPKPGTPRVHVGFNVKLVQMPGRTIIGSQDFDHKVEARADRLPAIIEAYDDALGKVLKRLVEWTLITGDQAYKRRPTRRRTS